MWVIIFMIFWDVFLEQYIAAPSNGTVDLYHQDSLENHPHLWNILKPRRKKMVEYIGFMIFRTCFLDGSNLARFFDAGISPCTIASGKLRSLSKITILELGKSRISMAIFNSCEMTRGQISAWWTSRISLWYRKSSSWAEGIYRHSHAYGDGDVYT